MQIGTQEHKAQYFQDLLKTMRENIYFGEFQVWTIKQSLEKLQADKAEAEGKLERKEFESAGEGRNEIQRINEMIQNFLMQQAGIEDQNKMLENRIIEMGEYVKGWKTE
jgi:hypothetical protein